MATRNAKQQPDTTQDDSEYPEEITTLVEQRSALTEMSGEQLLAMLQERQAAGEITDVQDVTGDFSMVDKSSLVGVEFTVVHWAERESSENGRYDEFNVFHAAVYNSIFVVTPDGRKLMFNDGGVGIGPVLHNHLKATGRLYGVRAPWGLHASEYTARIGDREQKATTYYFATSAPKKARD